MKKPMIIDCFAGGGGASVGIEMALGRPVDIAINHDPYAILMHRTNHPDTLHLTEDIFHADLAFHIKGNHVGLMWASPDCTSHSKAKGGKPRHSGLRILPWAVYKHAKEILPDVIIMENVEEIQQWGPLDENGYPIQERKGEEYQKFIEAMMSLGYAFDSRELIAADFGAPTTRKRWYAIFRRDNKPIVWPQPTHNKEGSGGCQPWVPVHSVLDLSDMGKSIFGRKKPLAENTLQRIARGIKKYVVEHPDPFLIQVNHGGDTFRGQSLHTPLPTITQKHGFGIVQTIEVPVTEFTSGNGSRTPGTGKRGPGTQDQAAPLSEGTECLAFLTKFYKSGTGQGLQEPLHTITTSPGHFGQVSVLSVPLEDLLKNGVSEEVAQKCSWVSEFLIEYYGSGTGQPLTQPLHTIVTKDRFALITVLGNDRVILDIRLRMLSPEELKLAQGFPKDYIIERDYRWKTYPVSERVRRIGNSVVPVMAQVLVEANCAGLKAGKRTPCVSIAKDDSGQLRMIV